ncbi:hypothetical protein SAMN04488542_103194 [Fontibacillus panacisegetis]|uniref:Uncharacterized protein n=1 Tax=Fontibacillus panacisegetis TaxID=670482 RepID=A0A1G7GTM1_9BACL|nr:hypothetical protein [Fontibacillus panacisegetis]SDE91510.1 hypothetical protein SAMN04488542_103194 [Fontibacillus panacisegetis]
MLIELIKRAFIVVMLFLVTTACGTAATEQVKVDQTVTKTEAVDIPDVSTVNHIDEKMKNI